MYGCDRSCSCLLSMFHSSSHGLTCTLRVPQLWVSVSSLSRMARLACASASHAENLYSAAEVQKSYYQGGYFTNGIVLRPYFRTQNLLLPSELDPCQDCSSCFRCDCLAKVSFVEEVRTWLRKDVTRVRLVEASGLHLVIFYRLELRPSREGPTLRDYSRIVRYIVVTVL